MKIKSYGNATFSINNILFDPFIALNPECKSGHLKDYSHYNHVFITHGHFDHVKEVEMLLKLNSNLKVFGPQKVIDYHIKQNWDQTRCFGLKTGDVIHFDDLKITYFSSKHIHFDRELVLGKLKKINRNDLDKITKIYQLNKQFPLLEIGAYFIEADINVLVLGSCGLDDDVEYPKNIDILILAYQGNTNIDLIAKTIIEKLNPKRVLCHHLDDGYPPLTQKMDIRLLQEIVEIPVDRLE